MKNLKNFQTSCLFANIAPADARSMLGCLKAVQHSYEKGETIFFAGEKITQLGLVLSGCVHIQTVDFWGNCSLLGEICPGEIFAESYALPGAGEIPNDVVAATDCEVLLLDAAHILTTCSNACRFHTMLVGNLFSLMAEKNRNLAQKAGHLAQRSIRSKLLSYLSAQSRRAGSAEFVIPFNRQQLADFLSVDRSAMCAELSKMQHEGILRTERSQFTLL